MTNHTLTNDKLLSDLLRNSNVLNAFPFLRKSLSEAPPPNCSSCQAKKYLAGFRQAAEEAKAQIAAFSPEDAAKLKSLLGMQPDDTIRIWYLKNGKTEKASI